MKTLARYTVLLVAILLYGWLFLSDFYGEDLEDDNETIFENSAWSDDNKISPSGLAECSMHSCFDYSRCRSGLKVFVYPDLDDLMPSEVYRKILLAIRESRYYVSDPKEACLFVVSVDTIDRDKISENYVRDVDRYISDLPADVWNNGVNHIIFNLYHGTYPDYSDHNLGFDTGKAMIARASPSSQNFRFDFDISFPLFHKEHPTRNSVIGWQDPSIVIHRSAGGSRIVEKFPSFEEKGKIQAHEISFKTKDHYIVSFKGKRYVYGIGSETRDSLHHLHNGETVAMVTTCRHNNDWQAHQDARCESDNEAYDKWDYESMMANSTFCLTPRGRRLGSFRFLESLRLGCIPVVLSDDWVLPFDEIIDWSAAAVVIPENDVLLVPDILYTFTKEKIFQMKQRGFFIYSKYFSSVEKIAITALEIVWDRVRISEAAMRTQWNRLHSLDVSFGVEGVTAIVKASEKPSSRLQKVVMNIAKLGALYKTIILWPRARGVPPVGADFGTKMSLEFLIVNKTVDVPSLQDLCGTGLLMFIDERLNPSQHEMSALLDYSWRNPARLVGVHGVEFDWQKGHVSMGRVYNALFFSMVVFHSYYLTEHASPIPTVLWNECFSAVLNVVISEQSMLPPMVLGERKPETWMKIDVDLRCFKKLTARWQNELPLVYSDLRFV